MSSIVEQALRTWQSMRLEYQDYLEAHMSQAETETNGILLNARGQANNIMPARLFASNRTFANTYASEELIDF